MGVNASRAKFLFDAADSVTLRDVTDGAEAPSGSSVWETAVSLDELNTAYWHNYEIPQGVIAVCVNVTAMNAATNVYTIKLRVDDVLAQNNSPVTVADILVPSVGVYYLYVDSKNIPKADPDHNASPHGKWIAVGVTESGTPSSPSITYGAWMAKSVCP